MAVRDLLDPEIFTFDGRDFANWLKAGIPVYTGTKAPMADQRVPDAFPYARGFIGMNEAGLADDLKHVYDQLPSVTQVAMESGVALLWAETEFKDAAQYDIARVLLQLGCRLQVKAFVDVLPNALTLLAIAHERADTEAARRQVLQIRRQAFQAAVELASSSSRSIRCLELFMEDASIDEPLLQQGQALKCLGYLSIKYPYRFVYWAGIFGQAVVADHKADGGKPSELRFTLEKEFGKPAVQTAIQLVRNRGIDRIETEDGALSLKSMRGLYDLVSILHAGRSGAPAEEAASNAVYPWEAATTRVSSTAKVLPFDPSLRKEIKGL